MKIGIASKITLDRTRQAAPQVTDYLREQILALELVPGAQLSRLDLQNQFGLSQTPVRDALRKLEEEGLVTVFPQHATLVSRIDLAQAGQTHFMRRALEADIVRRLAIDPPEGFITEMRRANTLVQVQADAKDYASFLIADRSFHHKLFSYAGMLMNWSIIRANSGHLDRLRRLNLPNIGFNRIVLQHNLIVDAMEARKPDAAEAALRDHLSGTLSALDSIAERYPQFIAN